MHDLEIVDVHIFQQEIFLIFALIQVSLENMKFESVENEFNQFIETNGPKEQSNLMKRVGIISEREFNATTSVWLFTLCTSVVYQKFTVTHARRVRVKGSR